MTDNLITQVVSFVGTSNSGKTTLLEKVIKELKHKAYRVGIIKHTYQDCEIDQPGKDTWRYARAGSDLVALSSPAQAAIIEYIDPESGLAGIVSLLIDKVDIILTEGYKDLATAKVLVKDKDSHQVPCFNGELLATLSPSQTPDGILKFEHEDVVRIVDLLTARLVASRA
ncbi:MAG: molybdopterin-guanine dinucleotide biosynthesis protein B [Chloroflexi bacterium]|nr:molybdopterin-guanine dinucleotide biosynthesis protein B [Chloroflexota bacterium]